MPNPSFKLTRYSARLRVHPSSNVMQEKLLWFLAITK